MAIARIAMTYPRKVLRGPNGSWGASVMSDSTLSCGPTMIARCRQRTHTVCDRLDRTVKKMYNKQASIKIVSANTL